MNKWMKKLTAALCAAVLMCGMAVTAYAGGGEEWDGLQPVEPLPTETVDSGEGFTEDEVEAIFYRNARRFFEENL